MLLYSKLTLFSNLGKQNHERFQECQQISVQCQSENETNTVLMRISVIIEQVWGKVNCRQGCVSQDKYVPFK